MTSSSIFMTPWCLDAMAPGQWQEATVVKDDQVVARLPYLMTRQWKMNVISAPAFAPYLGPWWQPIASKRANRYGTEKELLSALLDQLPAAPVIRIACPPGYTNMLPFYWAGYDVRVRYTYRITDLSDTEAVWSGLRDNIRREIRKAQKKVTVVDDLGIEAFHEVTAQTFARQGQASPYTLEQLQQFDQAMSSHQARKIFFAVDEQSRIHAVNYMIWDERCAYYLMGGADPQLRNSGAQSLLMWHAIEQASASSRAFDFEGSMIEPIERFFRAFGGEQLPYYVAYKVHPLIRSAMAVRQWLTGRRSNL